MIIINSSSLLTKTRENCFYIVNLHFPCTFSMPSGWRSNLSVRLPLVKYRFKNVSARIAHPVFYVDPVYKLRRVKSAANFVSSGSKIVKRLRHREYDPIIIKMTIGLVHGPSVYNFAQIFPKALHYNKVVGTI